MSGLVQTVLLTGRVAGHVPQLHLPIAHVQSVVPKVQVALLSVQAEPAVGSVVGQVWQCQLTPYVQTSPCMPMHMDMSAGAVAGQPVDPPPAPTVTLVVVAPPTPTVVVVI